MVIWDLKAIIIYLKKHRSVSKFKVTDIKMLESKFVDGHMALNAGEVRINFRGFPKKGIDVGNPFAMNICRPQRHSLSILDK